MEDLIKQLRETPSRNKRELLDKAADAIEELSQRWISVHDRLPEMSGEYLVATVTGYVGVRHFYVTWPRSFQADTVTHWMPLPEPPEKALNPCDRCMSGSYRGCDGCGHAEKNSEGGLS